jgi:hypothetical protein
MSTLWTFGDSFTKQHNQEYIDWKGYGIKQWPELLGEIMGYEVNNFGKGGSSNYQIFDDVIEQVNMFQKNDVVIIGWGLVGKFRYVHNNEFKDIHPNDVNNYNYGDNHTFNHIAINRQDPTWFNEIYRWEKLIEAFCDCKNVKVYFWSSEDNQLIYGLPQELKQKRSYICNDSETNLITHMVNNHGAKTINKETKGLIGDHHLSERGHLTMANVIYDCIRNSLTFNSL